MNDCRREKKEDHANEIKEDFFCPQRWLKPGSHSLLPHLANAKGSLIVKGHVYSDLGILTAGI